MNERGISVQCTACERRNRVPFNQLHRRGKCAACGTPLPYVHRTVQVSYDEAFERLITLSSVPVLVEFYVGEHESEAQLPASELEVVASCARGDYVVARADVGTHTYLMTRYNIRRTPMMILFVKGIDLGRLQNRLTAAELERYVRSAVR